VGRICVREGVSICVGKVCQFVGEGGRICVEKVVGCVNFLWGKVLEFVCEEGGQVG
jgi:hypothetical protein